MNHLVSLGGKEHENGVQKAEEGPWRHPLQEHVFVPGRPRQFSERKSSEDRNAKGDSEENGYVCRNRRIGHIECATLVADDSDEEHGEGGKENHLEDRVNGY